MSKIICLDPGHGGKQPGATNGKRLEKDDVLELALAIRDKLAAAGVTVVMTRETDKDVGIDDRCKIANDAGAQYFLSIHRNAATATATGHEIWISSKATAEEKEYARTILNAVGGVSNQKDRGVKAGTPSYTDFGVNSGSLMPSALLELGFISNSADNADFDAHLNEYATAIAGALYEIVGVPVAIGTDNRVIELEKQNTALSEENEMLKSKIERIREILGK